MSRPLLRGVPYQKFQDGVHSYTPHQDVGGITGLSRLSPLSTRVSAVLGKTEPLIRRLAVGPQITFRPPKPLCTPRSPVQTCSLLFRAKHPLRMVVPACAYRLQVLE